MYSLSRHCILLYAFVWSRKHLVSPGVVPLGIIMSIELCNSSPTAGRPRRWLCLRCRLPISWDALSCVCVSNYQCHVDIRVNKACKYRSLSVCVCAVFTVRSCGDVPNSSDELRGVPKNSEEFRRTPNSSDWVWPDMLHGIKLLFVFLLWVMKFTVHYVIAMSVTFYVMLQQCFSKKRWQNSNDNLSILFTTCRAIRSPTLKLATVLCRCSKIVDALCLFWRTARSCVVNKPVSFFSF